MTDATLSEANSPATADSIWTRQTGRAVLALLLLIALADFCFFRHQPGISLALFCLALSGCVLALHPHKLTDGRTAAMLLVTVLATLPLVESANLLWWPMAMGAVSLLTLSAADLLPRYEDWLGATTRFNTLAPVRLVADAWRLVVESVGQRSVGGVVHLVLVWIVPLVCAAVFVLLFAAANPVIEFALRTIRFDELLKRLDPARIVLWGFTAVISWPILVPKLLRWEPAAPTQAPMLPRRESVLFGGAAIRNSLVVFNLLFAAETLTDIVYLWGGMRLPDGLSYADYAHHAAYPLVITAVLAGAFVVAAMRRDGPGRKSELIRGLVYVWIAQNVWLVISAILRLKLYVETYELTEWRIAAGIWMALVAVGLLLILTRIVLDKSNKWLVMSNFTALVLTLYGVSFVDFPAVISWFNVTHSWEMQGTTEQALDVDYLGNLGEGVIPAVDYLLAHETFAEMDGSKTLRLMRENLAADAARVPEWQAWTWRGARLRDYLRDHPYAPDGVDTRN